MKIVVTVAALALAAGATFRATGAAPSETDSGPSLVRSAPYDPTAQPDFKGPEMVSGPDEPAIPGGAFNKEKYAFCQMTGNFLDGSRESCMSHNYCESVWWLDDKTVVFADNIMNTVLVLDGDRLHRLAGSGVRGDKDGPAECAEFSLGVYINPHPGLAPMPDGSFFISDPLNGKIKKIFKKPDGRWWVQTVAGGGTKTLKVGDVANALEVKFMERAGPHAIWPCGPNRDHVYMMTGQQAWRMTFVMSPEGK
jgi:hypothetical protein